MLWLLVVLPALCGIGCAFVSPSSWRRGLMVVVGAAHLAITACLWHGGRAMEVPMVAGPWLMLDGLAFLFLLVTDVLFLLTSLYAYAYLEERHGDEPPARGILSQEALFPSLLLLFLAVMSLSILSQHCVVTWVAVEATTLITASLICYHRSARSLEAAWKYLLICSVGIAIALAGNMALAVALSFAAPGKTALTYANLLAHAGGLQPLWLKIGFVLLLIGYGTKIGLFPLHTWLPDAHSEAPAPVSALLSGALLNCAMVALLRVFAAMNRAGMGDFAGQMLGCFGLLSVAVAAAFVVRQRDFKRLLAYSSIEHMGIIALGMSCGFMGREAAACHVVNHSFIKGMLFLTAGNLLSVYGTKAIAQVRGVLADRPGLGVLWLAGLLAICGFPPFGLFVSELWLVRALAGDGRWATAAGLLLLLGVVFVGMSRSFIRMAGGAPQSPLPAAKGSGGVGGAGGPSAIDAIDGADGSAVEGATDLAGALGLGGPRLSWLRTAPCWALAALSLCLGLWLPGWLRELFHDAALIVGGAGGY